MKLNPIFVLIVSYLILPRITLAAGPGMIKHVPFEMDMCLACHTEDKDGKPVPDGFALSQPDMCYQCHDKKDKGTMSVHPALSMDCTTCHQAHESQFKPLLKDKVENVCLGCHEDVSKNEFSQPFQTKHSALKMTKSCVRCHNPHSSDNEKLLIKETPQLCTYCHSDIGKGLDNPANNIHPAVLMGCQSCHSPHGSDNSKLLKDKTNNVCFTCHEKQRFEENHPGKGHKVSGVPDKLYPERELSCISCHKPHFSKNEKLFRYNFKTPPYTGSICSVCHWDKYMAKPGPPRPKWND
jgi:predicted CXXCH cytochrome family protein